MSTHQTDSSTTVSAMDPAQSQGSAATGLRPHLHGERPTMVALSTQTLLWCWIVLHARGEAAVRAAVARATVPAGERDRGEALSTAAITVGLVIIAGIIILALKAKSQTIVSNVCTNADPSSC